MSDDLVKRLRRYVFTDITIQAADRIEELQAALEKIAQHDMQAIALDALRPDEPIRGKRDEQKSES